MGQRKHQRVKMVLPIRISGLDENGKEFSQLAHTLDFSRMGARLGGVQAALRVGDEITVEYKRRRGHFKVQWVKSNPPEVGVEKLGPERFVFLDLPDELYKDDIDESRVRRTVVAPSIDVPSSLSTNSTSETDSEPAGSIKAGNGSAGATIHAASVRPIAAAGQLADLKRKLRETKDDTDGALQLVATTARELLSASGAAVAVTSGEEWICRASSGIAPRIGVHFHSPQGLTGQAAVSAQVVICADTEEDRRVNPSIWRSVQLRSTASVPIMRKTKALGVLELFAEQPNAFRDEHVPLLSELGELLADLVTASFRSGG